MAAATRADGSRGEVSRQSHGSRCGFLCVLESMGHVYRTVQTSFWTDPKVRPLPPKAKLIFAYLITSPSSHVSGIYYLPLTIVPHETSLSLEETREAFSLLTGADLVAYDDITSTVWVKNMLRHQGRGQKILKSVEYQLASLHNSVLIKSFLEYYQELRIPYRRGIEGGADLSSPSPSPSPSSDLRGGRRGEGKPLSEAEQCVQFLSDKIFENFPKRTAPTAAQLKNWARDADRIHRIDGHSWEDIKELLAWSQADPFWRQNILSMGSFREQWNRLIAKKQSSNSGSTRIEREQQARRELMRQTLTRGLEKK